jgi:two-component system phosphate regulon response regulator PhoB
MQAQRILVVEDDEAIGALVSRAFRTEGFETEVVTTGEEALRRTRARRPSVILLDVMLPGLSGTDVLRELRREPRTRELPVVLVTARSDEVDRVVGFELGADDYVPKPFSARELVLRVRALLRRTEVPEERSSDRLRLGPLEIDVPGYRVAVDGQPVPLTALEFRLLLDLARHPGRVQSRDQLLERVWQDADSPEPRTVDNLVKRLREKLGAARSWIETIRGVGYRLREPA